jgi:TonB family protein
LDKRILLEKGGLSYGTSSLGPSLCASSLLHVLPLGGLLLWQEITGEIGEISDKYPTPMTIELVYENQNEVHKEDCVIKPKAEIESKRPEKIQSSSQKIQRGIPQESSQEEPRNNEERTNIKPSSNNQKPRYPLRAKEERIQGIVYLRITIQSSGQVVATKPLEPRAHPLLEKAAIEAVSHWTYVLSGPIRTTVRDIPIIFELD